MSRCFVSEAEADDGGISVERVCSGAGSDLVDVRWREPRAGRRGGLARRVRLGVERGEVAALIHAIGGRVFADEYEVTMPDTTRMVVDTAVLLAWGDGARHELTPIPTHVWGMDEARAREWVEAIDGARRAIGRLAVAGVVDTWWAERLIGLLHTAVQSLPRAPVSFWRP